MFPPKKKSPPFGKSSDLDSPDPVDMPRKAPASEDEPPAEESTEDYGSKLVADLEAAGQAEGMDPETTKRVAASFFRAMADCLGGGAAEPEMPANDEAEPESEDY